MTTQVTPAYVATQRALGWPDIHPEDYCHLCGGRNPLWYADRTMWRAVTATWAQETGREGICCPGCFARMAQEQGVHDGVWRFAPEPPPDLQPTTTAPSDDGAASISEEA
ncbi:hypothetical protein [Nocardioides alcanivorans]|uniref:hypothetical protein n=1 Tax=Nocardioides alcanivorans TaxID=2897352 RepID=UPI001F23AAD2|nr:hypothetical protein [Nocardioides alcanivorans]